jgi:hypothetical protein
VGATNDAGVAPVDVAALPFRISESGLDSRIWLFTPFANGSDHV